MRRQGLFTVIIWSDEAWCVSRFYPIVTAEAIIYHVQSSPKNTNNIFILVLSWLIYHLYRPGFRTVYMIRRHSFQQYKQLIKVLPLSTKSKRTVSCFKIFKFSNRKMQSSILNNKTVDENTQISSLLMHTSSTVTASTEIYEYAVIQ